MDPRNSDHRRNRSTPQSIPLQPLNRPPDDWEQEDDDRPQHRRTLSERGRSLLQGRGSYGRGGGGRYAPLDDTSGPELYNEPDARPNLSVQSTLRPAPAVRSAEDTSPLGDGSGFQQAIGFAGLRFEGEGASGASEATPYGRAGSFHTLDTSDGAESVPAQQDSDDRREYFSPTYTDTAPLTEASNLQPSGGAGRPNPHGQRHNRPSIPNVRFLSPDGRTQAKRPNEDLDNVEAGTRNRGGSVTMSSSPRKSSLSPSAADNPLHRAGTIVRNMSQRVVNLSNEPEVVERSIKRKSSVHPKPPPRSSFVEVGDLNYDGPSGPASPVEKLSSPVSPAPSQQFSWEKHNPLRGKSLGIFSLDNPLRLRLCDLLVHPATEPLILLLIVFQTILLTIDSSQSVFVSPREQTWGSTWIDYCLLALFCVYTVEIIVRVIVSGFIINPVEYSTINRQVGLRQAIIEKGQAMFAPQRQPSVKRATPSFGVSQTGILRSFTSTQMDPSSVGGSRQQQRVRLAHRAFLRHSFNRLDFIAVMSFWISFLMSIFGAESNNHNYVFRMLSCLRILRLLGLTSGTSVILRSLKKAAPLLVNVAFLIGFFWLLFGIIGLQSFKSSLRRNCVWVDPDHQQANFTQNFVGNFQFCGGYTNQAGAEMPWLTADGQNGTSVHKGYLCPPNSLCVEGDNPYNGTVSFDNILQSLQLVFVIMTSNTFSDIMYYLTDSDYLAAALFFAAGLIIMALWLMNLLIAVITSSFQVIRDESKTSAFTAEESGAAQEEIVDHSRVPNGRISSLKRRFDKSYWLWIAMIVYGLIVQCLRSSNMSDDRRHFIDVSETIVTIILLFEIIGRFMVDWRRFFRSKRNIADLALAIITTIIQIPPIHESGDPYAWLSIFQILRIYRVVLAVPITRDLIMIVLRNGAGLLNLIIFVFLLTFLAALLAAQLFRGQLPQAYPDGNMIPVTFASIYNSFLGMYQILSSENWTGIMFNVTNFNDRFDTAWIGATFFILWYILANFIVLNMFIAVIQESFDVSEDEKRLQQVRAFLEQKELGGSSHGNLSLSSIFKIGQATGRRRDPFEYGSATTEMLLKDAVVKDFLDDSGEMMLPGAEEEPHSPLRHAPTVVATGTLSSLWSRVTGLITDIEPNPFYSRLQFSRAYEDLDPRQMAKEVVSATERRKKAQREYLLKHPTYNVSLYLFQPRNPLRRLCQRIVGPGRGEKRIEGVEPSVPVWYAFSAFIYAAIVAMVLLACITTPVYQREYFRSHHFSIKNWFVFTDLGFAILFSIEASIKVIADGWFWTPNAYFRGSWGFIDGIVLITLWVNVVTSLLNRGEVSRVVGAFKALRALRLLNVSDSARDTFHSVIVRGGWKVLSAMFVSLSLLIPFAIYGLNIFHGKMEACNDSNSGLTNLNDCVNEYLSTPYNWDVLAPRQVSNPYFDFDNFGNSLFILFQIVSQEGWIDVMWAAESITGVFRQPDPFASSGNALFFVAFNLLGAVFVLTLFVSVFMRNYTEQTGVAFLTTDQRSWLELRKLLRQVSPSKRPSGTKRRQTWEEWCYHRAVRKSGRWQKFVTAGLILHLALLCSEFYPTSSQWDRARDFLFFALILVYIANIVVRIVGLSWARFRKSAWDIYALIAVSGVFITTILLFSDFQQRVYVQVHKLLLVSIALLLIPRNNQLDQLFKTAAASLTSIANLLATWFVLFLVYAIAMTQTFGLTRFHTNETGNINFRTVPKALILLFRASSGEGWNQFMEDFATVTPPNCVVGTKFFDGDCGSPEWARALFITWNILSMYIFVNLFVSLIYESFSYVYQRSSGLSVISREEIRRYKQAWAEFDPNGTGYISKTVFPRLLGELSGIFEMRIYDGDFAVSQILEDCSKTKRASELPVEGHQERPQIDLGRLNRRLAELPVEEIRRRRHRMNIFYEEVLVSSDPDRGIGFTTLLMILAHYKVINDSKSLRLEEFLRRRARLQRVEEAVRRNTVTGFFDTLYWARRFRRVLERKKAGRMTMVPQFTVPEIFVDDEDVTQAHRHRLDPSDPSPSFTPVELMPLSTRDVTRSSGSDAGATTPPPESGLRSRSNSTQLTPSHSPTRSSFQLSPHRATESTVGADGLPAQPPSPTAQTSEGARSRQNSNVSAQDVLEVLDNSEWGASIRRSFTLRRPPGRQ